MVTPTRKTDAHLDDDDDFEDGVCKPGASVRCPIYLMDATQRAVAAKYSAFDARAHQPGFRTQTADAASHDRAAARLAYISALTDAWRTCGRIVANKDADPDEPDPNAANVVERERRAFTAEDVERQRRARHTAFAKQLSEAWKGNGR
jgi:hypothetical protein